METLKLNANGNIVCIGRTKTGFWANVQYTDGNVSATISNTREQMKEWLAERDINPRCF